MIRFQLRCENDHAHESWFASNAAFEALQASGRLECPLCGSRKVEKALMAPAVGTVPAERAAKPDPEALAAKLTALRRHVEATSDYVGLEFATEARAIHDGEAPERPIWGEARPDEAKALIEDGIPVAPLPFVARNKTN